MPYLSFPWEPGCFHCIFIGWCSVWGQSIAKLPGCRLSLEDFVIKTHNITIYKCSKMGDSICKPSWALFVSVYILFLPCCPLGLGGREGDGCLAMRNNGELAAVNFSDVSFTGIYNLKIVVLWNAPICLGLNQVLNHGKPSRSHWETDTASGATRFLRQGTKSGIQCILHSTLP